MQMLELLQKKAISDCGGLSSQIQIAAVLVGGLLIGFLSDVTCLKPKLVGKMRHTSLPFKKK